MGSGVLYPGGVSWHSQLVTPLFQGQRGLFRATRDIQIEFDFFGKHNDIILLLSRCREN